MDPVHTLKRTASDAGVASCDARHTKRLRSEASADVSAILLAVPAPIRTLVLSARDDYLAAHIFALYLRALVRDEPCLAPDYVDGSIRLGELPLGKTHVGSEKSLHGILSFVFAPSFMRELWDLVFPEELADIVRVLPSKRELSELKAFSRNINGNMIYDVEDATNSDLIDNDTISATRASLDSLRQHVCEMECLLDDLVGRLDAVEHSRSVILDRPQAAYPFTDLQLYQEDEGKAFERWISETAIPATIDGGNTLPSLRIPVMHGGPPICPTENCEQHRHAAAMGQSWRSFLNVAHPQKFKDKVAEATAGGFAIDVKTVQYYCKSKSTICELCRATLSPLALTRLSRMGVYPDTRIELSDDESLFDLGALLPD